MDIISFIPEPYQKYVLIAVGATPYITRIIHALRTGGGIRGAWRSIWYGTNIPKGMEAVTAPVVDKANG